MSGITPETVALEKRYNGQWRTRGVDINKPSNPPESKVVVWEKRDGVVTGKRIVLDRKQDFHSKFHSWTGPIDVKNEEGELEALKRKNAELEAKLQATSTGATTAPLSEKEEFEKLKEIGFKNLKGLDRTRYGDLKKMFETEGNAEGQGE